MGQEFLGFVASRKDGVLGNDLAVAIRLQTHRLTIGVIFFDERPVENACPAAGCQRQERVCQSMAIELGSSI